MKRLTTSIVFLLACATAFAQFEWAGKGKDLKEYDYTEKKGHILLFEGGDFRVIDSLGSVQYEFPEGGTDTIQAWEVLELLDGSFVYFYSVASASAMQIIDVGQTINSDWEPQSMSYIMCEIACYNGKSVPFDNTSIIKCEKHNPFSSKIGRAAIVDGHAIWEKTFDGTTFYDLAVLGDHFFLCTNEGVWKFDGDGNIADQWPNLIFERVLSFGDTILLTQSGDTLFRFTPGFVPLDTAIVTDGHVRHWDANAGRVGVLTTTNQYIILDGQLNVTASVPLDTAFFEFERTQVGGGSAFLAGGFTYGPAVWPTSGTFVKEYGLDGQDLAPRKDIGVANLANLQDAVVFHQGGKYHVEYDSLVVTVENFGDTAIHRLELRAGHYDQGDPTSPDTFRRGPSKGYSNVSPPLQPGESRAFVWKDARISFATDPAGHLLDLCVLTAQPNGGIDVDASNDLGCSGYVVGTDGVASMAVQATVHPSPASGQVTVSLPVQLSHPATWRLYDQLGREAMKMTLGAGQQAAAVSVGDLPQGLYFWCMASEGRQVGNGKLVVLKD